MASDSCAIEKLPNEVLLRILRYLYPPAAFQPFDTESICLEDIVWHEALLDAHLDMVNFSKVSRLFHALSVSLAQSHARIITEDKKNGLLLYALSERSLALFGGSGLMRFLERKCFRHNWGSSKTWTMGNSFEQVFQATIRMIASDLATKEKAERFNPLSWRDIEYNHTRRAVRSMSIVPSHPRYFGRLDSRISRFGFAKDEWLLRWQAVLHMTETPPPQVLANTE